MNLLNKVTRIRTLGKCFGMLLIFTSASLLAEDKTVTEDWLLTKNEVVEGTLTVNSGVTVTLNGYALEVKGLAGTGTITGGPIPSGYARLEYIKSTGSQYIDTGNGLYVRNGFSLIVR